MGNTTKNDELPVALTVPEVSRLLRVGKNRGYELVRCGAIQSIRIGRRIRVPRQAVLDFLSGAHQ